jgi:hypothetical protein
MENREAHNSDEGERREEEVHESSRVEGTGERLGNQCWFVIGYILLDKITSL